MLIGKTSKNLSKLTQLRASFCVGKALLDPYKHTTMSHSVHNMFVDLYPIGVYPEIIQVQSVAPRTYQPIVVSTCVDILNTAYVKAVHYLGNYIDSGRIFEQVGKNTEQIYPKRSQINSFD